ncbi:retrotransposon protein, putative, ty1-copia subclass [Tanacetum coccineum]
MMNLPTLPLSFWDYALESATRILNMVPTKKVDKTPYELWYGKVPNLSYLKVWGCEALVKRDTPDKLQQRSIKCIFIGYPKETMGYYFYFPPKNKIVVARYAKFFEKSLITQEVSGRAVDLKEIQDEDILPSKITSEIPMEVEGFEPPQEEVIMIRRVLISIAAFYDYEIWQIDVKTAFLNGYLDEDIYMVQPESFVDPKHLRKNPGEPHLTAVKNILKYLRNNKDMFLVYGGNPEAKLQVDCYCDAGFEIDKDDIKSQM